MATLRGALLIIALCSSATGSAQSQLDLAVTPAWGGWARPGRATELDIRVASSTGTHTALSITAGPQTLRARVALEAGRPARLHVPVSSTEGIEVLTADSRRQVALSLSESPLVAIALQNDTTIELPGFQAVTVVGDALPRNASAYASIDALLIDAATLAALDERQVRAFTSNAAQCGRLVVVNADERVRAALQSAAGCGGSALVFASSVGQALEGFKTSLRNPLPALGAVRPADIAMISDATWQRVVVLGLACMIVLVLALWWSRVWPLIVAVPVIATALVLTLLHVLPPLSDVVLWSESESGAQLAHYRAWQMLPGTLRGSSRAQLPPGLESPTSCDPRQPALFEFDSRSQRIVAAEFQSRLFRPVAICYTGELPSHRTVEISATANAGVTVRNAGAERWPAGVLVIGDRVLDLPRLGPGESTALSSASASLEDGVLSTARQRLARAKAAALWKLADSDATRVPSGTTAWLLVVVPST